MSFESGTFGFRYFTSMRSLPDDAVGQFAGKSLPKLGDLAADEVEGWVTGRHLLDSFITEDTANYGGYLRLALAIAEKKIPGALMKAECKMEELARLAASGRDRLTRMERGEIKESVKERLLPGMPYTLRGIPLIHDDRRKATYAGAMSDKQLETLAIYFRHTLGFDLLPWTPEFAALQRKQINTEEWHPVSFSPEVPDNQADLHAGRDFLTWLWFHSETRNGTIEVPGIGEAAFMLQGPLVFVFEGSGAHETALRRGEPLISAEAKTCLLAGKKLKSAKLVLAIDDATWQASVDAEHFVFRGVKLPDIETREPVGRFQERMDKLHDFTELFWHLYDQFLDERGDPAEWRRVQRLIHDWVKSRTTKR